MTEAVVFDLFGTLVSALPDEPYEALLGRMAQLLEADPDEFRRVWAETAAIRERRPVEDYLRDVCSRVGVVPQAEAIAAAAAARTEHLRRHLTPPADVEPTLRELRRLGYRRGLLSVCSSDLPSVWRELPLAALFDEVVFSCDEEVSKPDPRAFRLAAERLGVPPGACLFVDDQVPNLEGAETAGMTAVLIGGADGWGGTRITTIAEVLALVDGDRRPTR